MDSRKNSSADEKKYLDYGLALVDAVEDAIRPWLSSVIEFRYGGALPAEAKNSAANAIEATTFQALEALKELANADVDTPLSGPLERIRTAMGPVTEFLSSVDVPKPRRDPMDEEMRPNDVYALGPITFLDLGQNVHAAGITWGAAKAHVHMSRRNSATQSPQSKHPPAD